MNDHLQGVDTDAMRALLPALKPVDASIVSLRFGLNGGVWTLQQIADKHDITREAVRLRQERVLSYLRGEIPVLYPGRGRPSTGLHGYQRKYKTLDCGHAHRSQQAYDRCRKIRTPIGDQWLSRSPSP